jgi:hypothetical protein
MTLQLIGFDAGLNPNYRLNLLQEIINGSNADLILFPGHTLRDEEDIDYLDISNRHSTIIVELERANPTSCMFTSNELFVIKNGEAEDLYSCQLFATSLDINAGGQELMNKFFDELPRRRLTCCDKSVVILQCGETALLASSKSNSYSADFRFKDNPELNDRYREMLKTTDIFLNPIHTVQGEQGIMKQRRITLSTNGRYYASTASLSEDAPGYLKSKRLQYVYYDGTERLIKPQIYQEEGYVSRIINI